MRKYLYQKELPSGKSSKSLLKIKTNLTKKIKTNRKKSQYPRKRLY